MAQNKRLEFTMFQQWVLALEIRYKTLVNTDPPPPPTPKNDKTATFGLSVYSGRQIQAEYINSNSTLVNETINSITVTLKQVNPSTGTVYVGVFNPDLSIKRLFGTI